MDRRVLTAIVLMIVAPLTLAFTYSGEVQQPGKIPKIGILRTGSPPDANIEGLRQGLRELGYVEGQNIILEYRWADRDERLSELAHELVQLKVDVILDGVDSRNGRCQRGNEDNSHHFRGR